MAKKSRNQNPVVGDCINLQTFTRNSNNFFDVYAINCVDIFLETCKEEHRRCDKHGDKPEKGCCDWPDRDNILVETIPTSQICHTSTGMYYIDLQTSSPLYTIGRYHDVWNIVFRENDEVAKYPQDFRLYPDLWVVSPTPVVYSFDFHFTPNRIRHGSKKWLIIQIVPNVPRATDLIRYYENVAISADLKINIELNCGPCPPASEREPELIVDNELVTVRDKVFAYYEIDTRDWECGIYSVWFELCFAGNIEVSAKSNIQIF